MVKKVLPVVIGFVLLLLSATEGRSLPPCPGSYNETTWTNCFGKHTYGSKYVGEWKDHKRHGQGTFTYDDGRVKEGMWENNKFLYAKKLLN